MIVKNDKGQRIVAKTMVELEPGTTAQNQTNGCVGIVVLPISGKKAVFYLSSGVQSEEPADKPCWIPIDAYVQLGKPPG